MDMTARTSRRKLKNKFMRRCSPVRVSAKGLLWWSKPFKFVTFYSCWLVVLYHIDPYSSLWIIPLEQVDQNHSSKPSFGRRSHSRTNLKQVLKPMCVLKKPDFFTILDLNKHQTLIVLLNTFLIVQSCQNISFSVFYTNKLDTCKSTG